MKPANDGGPAFQLSHRYDSDPSINVPKPGYDGMTLRDYFAAHSPPMPSDLGVLALEAADVDNPDKTHGEKCDVLLPIVAEWRYRYADAMIAARGGAS